MLLSVTSSPISPAGAATIPVVAARKAMMSFFSEYRIASPILMTTLLAYDEVGRELRELQQTLLETLYRTIPQTLDPVERKLLLHAKRRVFKKLSVDTASFTMMDEFAQGILAAYNRALDSRARLLADNRDQIIRGIKAALGQLAEDPQFSVAVDYSCPWLLRRYSRASLEHGNELSEQDRSLYSYASKFFVKANPFYIFAAIMPPGDSRPECRAFSEIVVNLTTVLSLEGACLRSTSSSSPRRLYLRSYYNEENAICFMLPEANRVRVVRLQKDAVTSMMLSYFESVGKDATTEQFLIQLAEQLPTERPGVVRTLLTQLINAGIVVEYLITDFRHFGRDLMGILPELNDKIELLDQYHLSHVAPEDVIRVHNELTNCGLPRTEVEPDLYYVNNYCSVDLEPYRLSISGIAGQLRSLAPLLTLKSNFEANSSVMRLYLTDRLEAAPGNQLPLLRVAADFLRNFDENVSRPRSSSGTGADRGRNETFPELAMLKGNISDAGLLGLALKFSPGKANATGLCLNGPFDFESNVFYPSNIFAGKGRVFARYFLGRQTLPEFYVRQQNTDGPLDVQIAGPLHQNRNFVAPMLAVGCGLEARYSHLFETWIDPTDVLIELSAEGIRYRHAKSGRHLRFHFFGVILADYLIAPYQLLLLDHADFYENPFEGQASYLADLHAMRSVQYVPGLFYRSVCLRREQWLLSAAEISRIVAQREVLLATVELRDAIRDLTGTGSQYWFYKLVEKGKKESKPRFLDLCSPLSVLTLRKTVRALQPQSVLSFTEMLPGPQSGMFTDTDADSPVSTELMIEI